tara:strand:- start:42 stop:575 length:534 start_codon:yes stop_codon:yes gene_type:complete
MSYIIRDENGGERVIAPWGGLDIEGLPAERFPIEMSPSNEPTGWDRLPVPLPRTESGYDPVTGDRSERIPVIPYSEEETNQRKWGLLNSVVDAIKAGGSKLGDFLYGDTDFGYTDANEQDRMRSAEEQRKREFAEELRKKAAEAAYMQSINSQTIRQEPYRQGTLGLDRLGRTTVNY